MPSGLDLEVFPDPAGVAQAAARLFREVAREAVARRGRFTTALSGGSTPRALFELLARPPDAGEIPWAQTEVFWSDERCVPPDDPDSNYRMAREALLEHVPLPPAQVHRMPGELPVPQQAAREYTEQLRAVFGKSGLPRFDLLLLGLGEDGHTASIFPGVAVPDDPNIPVAAVFVPKVSMWRLTLTLPVLNAAARVLFLVTGAAKRQPLATLVGGPRSLDLPAQRVVPSDGVVTVIADRAAAGELQGVARR